MSAASSADRVLLEIEAQRFAEEVGIPPCPEILARFAAEMHSADPDMRRLAALIANDVGLSAALLAIVNSTFYGLERKAASVQQALSVLGLRAGANIVTGLMLKIAFPAGSSRLMQRFWEESSGIAAAAAGIAARLEGVDPAEAHTYALFRDCGIPVMLRRFPVYAEVVEANRGKPGSHLVAVEDNRFRFNHANVGFALARSWLLPGAMCKAILYHHQPQAAAAYVRDVEPANPRLVAFGMLAEQVVTLRSGGGLCPDWEQNEEFVLAALGIGADDVVAIALDLEPVAA
ncbi:MAG: HDOD domain-containing protein [Proteobacteria bacterium]|nr:HDOD domain-containing protein [Pseudomonadota bacterium]